MRISRELDRALEQHFRSEPALVQASAQQKQAVANSTLPTPVKAARIDAVVTGDLARMIRLDIAISESVSSPLRWKSRHRHVIELSHARSSLFVLRHEQQQYVADYLGSAPTLQRMASLPADRAYVRLTDRGDKAVDRARAAEVKVIEARPFMSGILAGTLNDETVSDYSRSYSDQVVAELAACGRGRWGGDTSSELTMCDPRPSEPERPVVGVVEPLAPPAPLDLK